MFAVTSIILLILPWYVKLPEIFSSWRVTGNWLFSPSGSRLHAMLTLPWGLISFSGVLFSYNRWDVLLLAILILVSGLVMAKAGWRIFTPGVNLLLLWLLAACIGPIAFDLMLNSYVSLLPRYAMTGMPAAILLIACGLARLPAGWRSLCILLIIISWFPHLRVVTTPTWRYWEPFKQTANTLDHQAQDSDLLIVHSTPTGVAGVARYLDRPLKIYSWVGQLRQRRMPEDMQALAEKNKGIVLVKIHTVLDPVPEEDWLKRNGILRWKWQLDAAEIMAFELDGFINTAVPK